MKFDIQEATKIMQEDNSVWGVIRLITEADYGCEELPEGAPIKDRVVIVTRDKEYIIEIEDQILIRLGLDEGSSVSYEQKTMLMPC